MLALQEASAIAMADAFAQVTRRPALVNLHSSAGVGNAMGNLVAAYHGNTPLIVTSGQQHRELMIGEPYLGNREATTMPKPWVKWSYEPYPYFPGDLLPAGTELLQITASPEVAGAARVGDSLLGDPKIAIDLLLNLVAEGSARTAPEPMARPRVLPQVPSSPLTPPGAPGHSLLAVSGPVMRRSSGNVARMRPRASAIPAEVKM